MVLRLFFSWQVETDSDRQHNKPFILECLNAAANRVQNKGELKGITIDVKEGVRGKAGTPDTIDECYERIDKCHIFVSDMTIAEHYNWLERLASKVTGQKHRLGPNRNVLTEYSRARSLKVSEQIITVMNTINGDVNKDNELFPIDIRKYRFPITFKLKKENISEIFLFKKENDEITKTFLAKTLKTHKLLGIRLYQEDYHCFSLINNNGIWYNKNTLQKEQCKKMTIPEVLNLFNEILKIKKPTYKQFNKKHCEFFFVKKNQKSL